MAAMPPEAVDLSSLAMLRTLQKPGATDAVGRIVDRFLEETAERLSTLHHAVQADDPRLVEQSAHALKGIAGTVGANEMHDLARQLEQLGRAGSTAGASALLEQLQMSYARAKPVYEHFRGA
jgi:two-component system, sensor histidine kinase and response regulator